MSIIEVTLLISLFMKKILVYTIIVIISLGCKNSIEIIEVKNEEGQLVEKYHRRVADNMRHGSYEAFDENGSVIESSVFQNDTLHGERIIYFENGQPQYVEQYKNGQFDDLYNAFYESGQLKLEGKYTNGAMNGEWKGYHENGQLKEVVLFENNNENGPFVEYHDNGKLSAEGTYLNGDKEHGELKLYDETGELYKTMNCDEGLCRTTWLREDHKEKKDNE